MKNAAPKSVLGKVLTYLKEVRLEFSSNRAERSRKDFMIANTHPGATGSAATFTLIQTAIENHLDSYRYL